VARPVLSRPGSMGRGQALRRTSRAAWRWLREAAVRIGETAVGLGVRAARLAELVAYRRQELVVVGLIALGVLGGFAVETWRHRAPGVLEGLEAERPRFPAPAPSPRPRPAREPRSARPRPAGERRRAPPRDPAPPGAGPLDLNRATADDLIRLPGIGPRLAARVLAQRDARGGRFDAAEDVLTVPGIGARKAAALHPLVRVSPHAAGGVGQRDPLEPWEPPP